MKNEPQTTFGKKMIFLLFGIGALLTYNAFLTELPFFNKYLKDFVPGKTIPFLNFALNITFQFLIILKKDLFELKKQLFIGLISSIILLILIPIMVTSLPINSIQNMIVTSILILIMGFINALLTSGFYALASFFPAEIIVSLNTGMAVAGILMNVIQYIVLISIDNEKIDIIALTFFIISGLILLLCLIILIFQFKTEYFKFYLKSLEKINHENNEENLILETSGSEKDKDSTTKQTTEIGFMEMFKILKDIDLLGMYIYIVTASLYPNLIISLQLFNLDDSYNVNTILLLINICDTVGRYMVVKVNPTKKLTSIVILSRTIIIATCLFNYYLQKNNFKINWTSIFVLFNIITLAISNGVGTSLCFRIAPTLVEEEYKGQAGASISFFATFGTFVGTILAFLTDYIKDLLS